VKYDPDPEENTFKGIFMPLNKKTFYHFKRAGQILLQFAR